MALVDDAEARDDDARDDGATTVTTAAHRRTRWIFTAASFLGSFLLFLVQPMAARFLLPLAGGSASLWNTAMVFFQVLLLAGYVYAHLSTTRFGTRQPLTQVALVFVPLAFLPVAIPDAWELTGPSPALWVLGVLAVTVGVPFFALATSSPTLQRWFSLTDHPDAGDPYFLYAAGNVGSVAALAGYPLVVEPVLTLDQQTRLWTLVYVAFVLATAVCAVVVRGTPSDRAAARPLPAAEPVSWARRRRWLVWAFVPSALMLGVTRHLAADVASFPLLWIVPLLLYLTTFIVVFSGRAVREPDRARLVVIAGSVLVAVTMVRRLDALLFVVGTHLVWFFCAALVSHHRLAADRPPPARLTEFYTVISIGGALGGVFASLVAPMIFDSVIEYPIVIVASLLVAARGRRATRVTSPASVGAIGLGVAAAALIYGDHLVAGPAVLAVTGIVSAVALRQTAVVATVVGLGLAAAIAVPPPGVIFQDRSFFGVSRVVARDGHTTLVSGTTAHGHQHADPDRAAIPTTYYAPEGPVGQLLRVVHDRDRVAVIGLGAGALAAYGRSGDRYTFYEIDPVVVDIATDRSLFGYLSDSNAEVEIVLGDGRRGIDESETRFDVVVVDAFSSDAIPTHLLTREAIGLYLDRLDSDGVLAVHVSNRFFDLRPVLGRVAAELGVQARHQLYVPGPGADPVATTASRWVVIGAPATLDAVVGPRWEPLGSDGPLWTDDYSNLLAVLDL